MARFVIAGAAFVLGVALLIVFAVREGGIPTVSVAHLESDEYAGEEVFLDGEVTEIQQDANPARFLLLDKRGGDQPIQIETREVLSDTFEVGSNLRVKGSYDQESKEFHANYVDTKCPSKYEGTGSGASSTYSTSYDSPENRGGAE